MNLKPVIDLGELKQPIFAPEISAAAAAAFKHGYQFAKLTTADGGVVFIAARPAMDGAPVKLTITGPVTIVGESHHPLALPPVHRRCFVNPLPPRVGLKPTHSAQ